jgi:hypothetical protein
MVGGQVCQTLHPPSSGEAVMFDQMGVVLHEAGHAIVKAAPHGSLFHHRI